MRFVYVFLFCAVYLSDLGTTVVHACNVRYVSYVKEYVAPVVVAQYVPLLVNVPAYGIGFAPAAAAAPAAAVPSESVALPAARSPCDEKIAKLEQEIAALRAERSTPAPALATATPTSSVLTLFSAKCATCHEAAVAKDKGSGFVLLKGGLVPEMSTEQLNKIITMTYSGKMPMKPPTMKAEDFEKQKLTDQEFATIMDWATTYKKK